MLSSLVWLTTLSVNKQVCPLMNGKCAVLSMPPTLTVLLKILSKVLSCLLPTTHPQLSRLFREYKFLPEIIKFRYLIVPLEHGKSKRALFFATITKKTLRKRVNMRHVLSIWTQNRLQTANPWWKLLSLNQALYIQSKSRVIPSASNQATNSYAMMRQLMAHMPYSIIQLLMGPM